MRSLLRRPSLFQGLNHQPLPYCAAIILQKLSFPASLHTSSLKNANILPVTATGPPPAAPLPSASQYGEQISRRRRQAELLRRGQDVRANQGKGEGGGGGGRGAMARRFWKDVVVRTEADGTHQIYLDARPVRNPNTTLPLSIPASKSRLATAIAIEWDNLVTAQQALRSHFIPLTSIASRAQDISLQDASSTSTSTSTITTEISPLRSEIVHSLLRYLDTDTILCWAPPQPQPLRPPPSQSSSSSSSDPNPDPDPDPTSPSLRALQIHVAKPIIAYLTQHVWPGVELVPTLDDAGSIVPVPQPDATRAVIKGWLTSLPAWELAGLERAVLAGKSLCVGARLVVEWSEAFREAGRGTAAAIDEDEEEEGAEKNIEEGEEEEGKKLRPRSPSRFGIEDALEACTAEVRWQTGRWGEVEDTHDVEKEDLRRQFGSVILLVGGTSGA